MQPTHATLLFLDWDSTLTTASTLPFIASALTYPETPPAWGELGRAYGEDMARYQGDKGERGERGGWEREKGILDSTKPIEAASLSRVASSGIFAGVTRSTLQNLAHRCITDHAVTMRPGWKDLMEHTQASWLAHRTGEVHIISVGWSEIFIQACLEVAGGGKGMVEEGGEGFVGVLANEVDGSGDGGVIAGSGGEGLMLTSGDKERVVRLLEKSYREQWKGSSVRVVSVYVGDSVTDLGGLMACDVGVCVREGEGRESGEQRELREMLERIGVEVRWIGEMKAEDLEGLEKRRMDDEEKKFMWWAKGLEEVVESPLYDNGSK
ncbi:MAG: hypothetical protein OHK93_006303 [Ramalina farinacea]|uniref:HAD-like protein n=1 Tax=Ramalina farinacea TaxID=258253 RepID=A0AA43QMK9_9LECA|nr:hypothetical protein [Ramalina farinacea]